MSGDRELLNRIVLTGTASFWLDGALRQTWSRVGVQPRVDTYGERKTAHVFGVVSLDGAEFAYQFAPVFDGHTFHQFLLLLVDQFAPRKIFLVIDSGSCHWLDDAGKAWLAANVDRIELHRPPPYSPEFDPVGGAWKCTRKTTSHNRFYRTVADRDAALTNTFEGFRARPATIEPQVARFR